MKQFLLISIGVISCTFICATDFATAQSVQVPNDYVIIPAPSATEKQTVIQDVSALKQVHNQTDASLTGSFRDQYNQIAEKRSWNLGVQLASGIVNRNTILDYVVYLVRFLSQIALLIGALMIIYAGYNYATTVFTGKAASKEPIVNAIIGILVVIFSYAIIRILTSAFLS